MAETKEVGVQGAFVASSRKLREPGEKLSEDG